MEAIRIGIIREGKIPNDKRTPFTPRQCAEINTNYSNLTIVVQESKYRCFSDQEFKKESISVVPRLEGCDILMGIKEVPVANLVPNKTYFFFSHTLKKQPHNKKLLNEILRKKISLIDYEALTDERGKRLVAFGKFAGIVGAYNGILFYGKRNKLFKLRRAYQCRDIQDLKSEFPKIKLPAIKIVLTGGGRVGQGAMSILNEMGIRQVDPREFINQQFDFPVYTQLNSSDYYVRTSEGAFNQEEFHHFPRRYSSTFLKYTKVADMFIAGAYWNPGAPELFTADQMRLPDFKIKFIADISCDIQGPIPATKRASSISDPIYDYDPQSGQLAAPLSDPSHVTVMAVDNLPCELPRDASTAFGEALLTNVIPCLAGNDPTRLLDRATIARGGELTVPFSYLSDYARN